MYDTCYTILILLIRVYCFCNYRDLSSWYSHAQWWQVGFWFSCETHLFDVTFLNGRTDFLLKHTVANCFLHKLEEQCELCPGWLLQFFLQTCMIIKRVSVALCSLLSRSQESIFVTLGLHLCHLCMVCDHGYYVNALPSKFETITFSHLAILI